ncbi:MAG: ATP-binding protein [Chloroflexi bacterium]|nr:ATP-binding protein [Chloroflexota bacterium]
MKAIRVQGTLDSLSTIREYVQAVAAEAGLNERASYRLVLAADEFATNIILHAYQEAGIDGEIEVWVQIDDQTIRVTLEDQGAYFDSSKHDVETPIDEPLETRQPGGWGIYLALNSVDDYVYKRVKDRNRNTFIIHRHPTDSDADEAAVTAK